MTTGARADGVDLYSDDFKAQAVRMVRDHRPAADSTPSPTHSVARLLGLDPDLLSAWLTETGTAAPARMTTTGNPNGPAGDRTGLLDFLANLTDTVADGLRAADPYVRCTVALEAEDGSRTLAASADSARDVDAVQFEAGDGPSLHAARTQSLVLVGDVTMEPRWPTFTWAAARHGVLSVVAVPLVIPGSGVAALSAYAPRAHAFHSSAIQQARDWVDSASHLLRTTDRFAD